MRVVTCLLLLLLAVYSAAWFLRPSRVPATPASPRDTSPFTTVTNKPDSPAANPRPNLDPMGIPNPMPLWAREPDKQPGFVTTHQKYGSLGEDYEKRYPDFFDPRSPQIRSQRDLDEQQTKLFRKFAAQGFYDHPTFLEGHAELSDKQGRLWRFELTLTFGRNSGKGDDLYEHESFPIAEEGAGYYLALRVNGPAGQGIYTQKAVIGSASLSEGRAYSFLRNHALESALGITALAVEIPLSLSATGQLRLRPFPSPDWDSATVTWKELPAHQRI